jgi:hypothetical protein
MFIKVADKLLNLSLATALIRDGSYIKITMADGLSYNLSPAKGVSVHELMQTLEARLPVMSLTKEREGA